MVKEGSVKEEGLPRVRGAPLIHVGGASFDKGAAEKSHTFFPIASACLATQRPKSPRGAGIASMPTGIPEESKSMATKGQLRRTRVEAIARGRPMWT